MSRQEKIDLLNKLNQSNQFTTSNFASPGRGSLRRPNTGMSHRSNTSKASIISSSRKIPTKLKKPPPVKNLVDLVKKSDKMSHELVIDYLNSLV